MNIFLNTQQLSKAERDTFYIYFLFTAFTVPIFLGKAFHAFGRHGYMESAANGVLALFIGGSLIGAAVARNKKIFYILHLIVLHLVIFDAFFQGGTDGSYVLWMYLLPLLTFFLLEKNRIIFGFMFASFSGIGIVFWAGDKITWIPYNYRPETQIRFFVTYVLVYLFTFLYTVVKRRAPLTTPQKPRGQIAHSDQPNPSQKSFRQMIREKRDPAGDELASTVRLLRSMIDNAPVAMYAKNIEGKYLVINQKGLDWLGVSRDDVIQHTDFDLFSHDVAERSRREDAEVISTRAALEIDRSQIVNDELFAAQIYKFPLFDHNGAISGVCGITNNISKRKQTEQEVQTLNERLEARLQQRTSDLEAVDKELTSVAYMIPHGLNAPLVEILHLTSWLMKDYGRLVDKRGKKMIGMLTKRVTHVEHLLESIALYAGVGRFAGDSHLIDTNALVQELVNRFAALSTIRIWIEHKLPPVVGDESHVKYIFQHLLQNAVKFLDKPRGEVMIDCADGDTHWTFLVADDGPGIPSQYQKSIFNLFQTIPVHNEKNGTDLGIGLAVCQKIVAHYGGRIWVESPPGYGSTFCFTFPK